MTVGPPEQEHGPLSWVNPWARRDALSGSRRGRWSPSRLLATYFLLILLVFELVFFSITLPDSFPTQFNTLSVLSTKAIIALLALAVMVPLAANQFDLSVAYVLGLTHVLGVGLIARDGLPWQLVVVLVLLVGATVGLVNGLLVTVAQIDSFIATLATGTFCYGLANWYTGGHQISGSFPGTFKSIANKTVLSVLPLPAIIAGIVAVCSGSSWSTGRRAGGCSRSGPIRTPPGWSGSVRGGT